MIVIFLIFLISMLSATFPSSTQIETFLSTHNYYRSTVNPPAKFMPEMTWLPLLGIVSNNWATRCKWAHSGTVGVGENLYATTVRTSPINFNPSSPVNSWGNEKIYYNYTTNICTVGKVCGHYTQVVWDDSVQLGCAYQDCPMIQGIPWANGGTIVVCQYYPAGNWWGERPYVAA